MVDYALNSQPRPCAACPIFTVDGGERAVIWHRFRGVMPDVEPEGTHFRIPFVEVRVLVYWLGQPWNPVFLRHCTLTPHPCHALPVPASLPTVPIPV